MTSLHSEMGYSCPRCDKSYKRKEDLNNHAAEKHGLLLCWRSAKAGRLLYLKDLMFLDESGILLEGRNPRFAFKKGPTKKNSAIMVDMEDSVESIKPKSPVIDTETTQPAKSTITKQNDPTRSVHTLSSRIIDLARMEKSPSPVPTPVDPPPPTTDVTPLKTKTVRLGKKNQNISTWPLDTPSTSGNKRPRPTCPLSDVAPSRKKTQPQNPDPRPPPGDTRNPERNCEVTPHVKESHDLIPKFQVRPKTPEPTAGGLRRKSLLDFLKQDLHLSDLSSSDDDVYDPRDNYYINRHKKHSR